eukprot:747583-Hanusia_phi.AAC.1
MQGGVQSRPALLSNFSPRRSNYEVYPTISSLQISPREPFLGEQATSASSQQADSKFTSFVPEGRGQSQPAASPSAPPPPPPLLPPLMGVGAQTNSSSIKLEPATMIGKMEKNWQSADVDTSVTRGGQVFQNFDASPPPKASGKSPFKVSPLQGIGSQSTATSPQYQRSFDAQLPPRPPSTVEKSSQSVENRMSAISPSKLHQRWPPQPEMMPSTTSDVQEEQEVKTKLQLYPEAGDVENLTGPNKKIRPLASKSDQDDRNFNQGTLTNAKQPTPIKAHQSAANFTSFDSAVSIQDARSKLRHLNDEVLPAKSSQPDHSTEPENMSEHNIMKSNLLQTSFDIGQGGSKGD